MTEELQSETPKRKFTYEELLAEATRRREADEKLFQQWMDSLPEERRKKYSELRLIGNELGDREYVFRKCRFALELTDTLKSLDGRRVTPVGIAIKGSSPVVLIQAEGHETKAGSDNLKTITHTTEIKSGGIGWFHCDIDTNEYGLPAQETFPGSHDFKLDQQEVEKRLAMMR